MKPWCTSRPRPPLNGSCRRQTRLAAAGLLLGAIIGCNSPHEAAKPPPASASGPATAPSEATQPAAATVQESAPPAERASRLVVGDQAPHFELPDQQGNKVALANLLRSNKVAAVFYRSADWWPYCKKQLVELQANLKAIEATGTQLVAISYDSTEILSDFAKAKGITFPLLSDADSRVIKAYGIHHQDGLPHPGTYVIDKTGVVRAALFVEGYKTRHTVPELLEALKATP